jgi:hypothetical protein
MRFRTSGTSVPRSPRSHHEGSFKVERDVWSQLVPGHSERLGAPSWSTSVLFDLTPAVQLVHRHAVSNTRTPLLLFGAWRSRTVPFNCLPQHCYS